jgi:purine-binding chemotaxis protein CheW
VSTRTSDRAEAERILSERARELAAPLQTEDRIETVGVLLVSVGDERYALALRHVVAIERSIVVTPVPGVPAWWSGIANVHGSLYPILDLGLYLGARRSDSADRQTLVLVVAAGIGAGLLVDTVADVTRLRADTIGPSPNAARARTVVQGVTPDLIALLDLDALLADPDLAVNDEAS